mgnify:CR=1 FL=1
MAIQITSDAFQNGEPIPMRHTCDGEDLSPPLRWSGVPEGAQSLVLITDDPDAPAGTWVHWVMFNIPPGLGELPEGVPPTETFDDGRRHGINDFRRPGYGGPCPPPGRPHRYFFRLYALDCRLDLPSGVRRAQVDQAMAGRVLAQGELMGTYGRSGKR